MAQLISMATAFAVTWILFARVWESVLNTTYCLMSEQGTRERGSKGEREGGRGREGGGEGEGGKGKGGAREGTGKIEIGGYRREFGVCGSSL